MKIHEFELLIFIVVINVRDHIKISPFYLNNLLTINEFIQVLIIII